MGEVAIGGWIEGILAALGQRFPEEAYCETRVTAGSRMVAGGSLWVGGFCTLLRQGSMSLSKL